MIAIGGESFPRRTRSAIGSDKTKLATKGIDYLRIIPSQLRLLLSLIPIGSLRYIRNNHMTDQCPMSACLLAIVAIRYSDEPQSHLIDKVNVLCTLAKAQHQMSF